MIEKIRKKKYLILAIANSIATVGSCGYGAWATYTTITSPLWLQIFSYSTLVACLLATAFLWWQRLLFAAQQKISLIHLGPEPRYYKATHYLWKSQDGAAFLLLASGWSKLSESDHYLISGPHMLETDVETILAEGPEAWAKASYYHTIVQFLV